MLGSFEELEKDIEKFKNNILASSELIESLNATAKVIKSQSEAIAEQTAVVKHVITEVPQKISESKEELVKQMISSNEETSERIVKKSTALQEELAALPDKIDKSLIQHLQTITDQNDKYLKECSLTFQRKQEAYIEQLKSNGEFLELCRKQLEESHASFIKKAEELDLDDLKKSVDVMKMDISKKMNFILVISALAVVATVVGVFI